MFFLDDAVALAAGRRPCGLCRRDQYLAYRAAVTIGSGERSPVLAHDLNRRLARERLRRSRGIDRRRDRIVTNMCVDELPSGAVIVGPLGVAHLLTDGQMQPFGFDAWGTPAPRPDGRHVDVLTPPTSLVTLHHGFVPTLH